MQKIPTLFERNFDGDHLVRDEVLPVAEWVIAGEGRATRKFDGTACMVRGGIVFKRYDVRGGKAPPQGFEPAQPAPDEHTGHWPGWLPMGDGPEDRWLREAVATSGPLLDGTYELVGPKVQGNPENFPIHNLVPHGAMTLNDAPRTFAELRDYLREHDVEGIVWHHPDGRMVKLKGRDFGLKRA